MESKKHVFSELEKIVFLDILKKYRMIVDCKKIDGPARLLKNTAWHKIATEYNDSPHSAHKVSSKQLRRLWMNMKHRQREKMSVMSIEQSKQHQMPPEDGDRSHVTLDPDMVKNTSKADDRKTVINVTPDSDVLEPDIKPPHLATNFVPVDDTADSDSISGEVLQNHTNTELQYKNEIHYLEVQLLKEKIREARAKADLAELILHRHKL